MFFFRASTATEVSQIFWPRGFFAGRFDPLDIVAYGAGLAACYGFDHWSQRRFRDFADQEPTQISQVSQIFFK
jgi:hypothetical protein